MLLSDKSRIMVVDDDPEIVRMIKRFLELEGYQIETANNGEEALRVFEKTPCDLIITDIRMPVMDGTTLLHRIKRLNQGVEVIILTGFGSMENAVTNLRDGGAFDYLTKPLDDMNRLMVTVKQALLKRRLKIKNRELVKDLKQNRSMARAAFDSISHAIIMLDPNLTVMGANRAALDFFGLKEFQDCIGQKCYRVFCNSDSACNGCEILNYLDTNETVEFERKGVAATDIVENITIYPSMDKGERLGILVKIQDVTQKVKIEEQRERTDRLASLGMLSAGISHEIRNPLHSILLFTDILGKHPDFSRTDREMDILEEIKGGIRRIDKIINQTLCFSRDQGKSTESIKINDLVEDNLRIWSSKLKLSGIKLDLRLGENLPLVEADRMGMHQVLNNLISNAIDSMESINDSTDKKGVLSIHTGLGPSSFRLDQSSFFIEINDTGMGIDEDDLGKIFNPFYSTKSTGTGLGLPIIHRIVKNHGGNITVSSKSGYGTSFKVEIPVIAEPGKSVAREDEKTTSESFNS